MKKSVIFIVLILISASIICVKQKEVQKQKQLEIESKVAEIQSHYSKNVKTNKETKVYIKSSNDYEEALTIGNNVILSLKESTVDYDTKYFIIDGYPENYYIYYGDVNPVEQIDEVETRYENYIPFDESIITEEITEFYNNGDLVYKINQSFELPIIIKEEDSYFVKFNNKLLEVKKSNVKNIKVNTNSTLEKASFIRVFAYHAFYDKNIESENWCRTSICHPIEQIEEQSKYLKENNYFTLNTKELEMFIDGKINIPKKSVMLTIDDGLLASHGLEILDKYELNATLFLITSKYKPESFIKSKYIEYHSHGHNIHNVGDCPTGQGGAIQCLNKEMLINDLNTSSEILNGSKVFCYPFFEYNSYSIQVLKEAGYKLAFAGYVTSGKVTVGTNKYVIPRYTVTNDMSLNDFIDIIKG